MSSPIHHSTCHNTTTLQLHSQPDSLLAALFNGLSSEGRRVLDQICNVRLRAPPHSPTNEYAFAERAARRLPMPLLAHCSTRCALHAASVLGTSALKHAASWTATLAHARDSQLAACTSQHSTQRRSSPSLMSHLSASYSTSHTRPSPLSFPARCSSTTQLNAPSPDVRPRPRHCSVAICGATPHRARAAAPRGRSRHHWQSCLRGE